MSTKFAPTADQRGNVEAMTGFGISQEEICRVVINSETGIRELHRAAYRGGRKRYRRGRPSGSRRSDHSNTATASGRWWD
jgi:hypothetical protein